MLDLRPKYRQLSPEDFYQPGSDPVANLLQSLQQGYAQGQVQGKAAKKKKAAQDFIASHPEYAGYPLDESNVDMFIKQDLENQGGLMKTLASQENKPKVPVWFGPKPTDISFTEQPGWTHVDVSPEVATQGRFTLAGKDMNLGESDEKMIQKYATAIDPNKRQAGELGKNQARYNAAKRVLTLYEQTGGNPDPRQMREVATAVAGLLTNGSGAALQQINELVPHSISGDAQKIAEWWSNNPRGLEQQHFAQRLGETAVREGNLAADMVHQAQEASGSGYADVLERHPERAAAIRKAMIEGLNGPLNLPSFGQGPQVGEVRKGYRFKGGNPADKANWEKAR